MNTDFDDDSPSGHVVTPTADGLAPTLSANPPTIDTTTKKYGAGSGKFVKVSSQRAAFTDSPYWTMADSNFTVRGWFNWTTHTADACLVAQASSLASRQLFLYYWSAGQLGFFVYTESATRAYYYVAFTPTNDQWYHIQVSRNGSSILLFIDGVSQTLTEVNAIGTYSIPNINGAMGIGYQPSQAQYFNGHIDDLEIAKDICRDTSNFTPPAGAIVPDEYTRLYMPMDADFNSSYLPLIDTSIKEVGAGSGQFVSPFGDYLSIADSDDFYFADNDFDITGYFYLRSHPIIDGNYDYFFYILGQTEDINNRWNITYQESGGKSYITIFTKDSGITRADIAGDMGVLATLDHWYKFKCSRVGSNLLVYIDDVLLALTGTDIGTKSFADLATPLQIAKDALTSYPHYFDGHLDEIKIITGVEGQTYYETLDDYLYIADSRSRQANIGKSDYLSIADARSKQAYIKKSDYLSIADSRSKQAYIKKSDNVFFTDAFSEQGKNIYFGFLSDDVYLSDSRQKRAYISKNDYLNIGDSASRYINVLFRDTVYIVEAFNTGGKVYFKVLSDDVYMTDNFIKSATIKKDDAIHIIDALSKQIDVVFRQDVFFVEVFVSGSGQAYFDVRWDYLHVADSSQKTAYIQKNDYMGVSDSLSKYATQIKSDLVHIGDSLSKVANRVYNDIVTFTDHIRNEIAFTFSTLFNVSDRFTKVVTTSKDDSLHISDGISKMQLDKRFNDVIAFTDTRQKHITFTFNDIVHIIDTLVQQFGVTFNDKIQISDSYTKEADIGLNELVTFTDTWGAKHIDIVVDDKIVFEDIKTELTNMGMSDSIKFTDDHFEIKLKTTDMVTIHLAVRLP
jgi:hypothetical protein